MKDKKIYSIHSRLIFFYTLTVVTLLVLLTFAFYWETQNLMHQADYSFVTDEAANIQSIMADDVLDRELLKKSVIEHPLRTRNSLYRYYIRIIDDQGRVFMETPGLANIIPVASIPAVGDVQHQSSTWQTYRDSHYLIMNAPIRLYDGKQHGYVQVALDTTYQHTITHDRRIFVVFLLAGMLLSLLLGKVVTSRGLRSLDILTNTVKTISTSSLHQRVNPDLLPSELTTLAKAFNQMLDRIETSFDRMHQLSADMSHELRTPINNLIGQTELLLSCDFSEADLRNALASNLEELQRMTSLIENILFLARAESQLPEIEKHEIDVMVEVNNICEYYQAFADDKNIQLETAGKATLRVNKVMFRRLMSNLISNAIKYSGSSTVVSIHVAENEGKVSITVSDSGIGIAEQDIPRLFDRFYRVDDSRSATISGTGLGLAIAKSIVDLHHGSISVESVLNEGTRITVVL